MAPPSAPLSVQRADLLQYVGRRVRDRILGEDIVQEAYLRLLTFQAKTANVVTDPPALLRRISLNLIRDHFRQAGMRPAVELSEDLACARPDAHQQLEQRQLLAAVTAVLEAMPPLRRTVFIHRRVHGQSSKQVAAALKLSPGAVDVHVARAVLDLHRAIEEIETRGGVVKG